MKEFDVKYDLCMYLTMVIEAEDEADAIDKANATISRMSKKQIIDWISTQVDEWIDIAGNEPIEKQVEVLKI